MRADFMILAMFFDLLYTAVFIASNLIPFCVVFFCCHRGSQDGRVQIQSPPVGHAGLLVERYISQSM